MERRVAYDMAPEGQAFAATMVPGKGQHRLAVVALVVSVAIFAGLVPFTKVPLRPVMAFIPAYQSALVVNDLITAVLLFGQYRILRSRALLALATGYLFTAFMASAHALTFPGLVAPGGLLGAGPQTTAWLYMFWHGGFPCLVIAYALLNDAPGARASSVGPGWTILGAVAAALAMAGGFTLVATAGQDTLPAIMRENHYTPSMMATVASVWLLSLVALVAVYRRRSRSILDLWLMVVMCAWVFDVALSAVLNAGRFDVGFYAGRMYGLLAASFVLAVMLTETWRLSGQLVLTTGAAQRKAADLERVTAELEREGRERAAALEALHHKEEETRAVVNNIADCVISIDSRGVVRGANPAVERVLGYAEDELVGRNVSVLMSGPDAIRHDHYLARYRDTGEARVIGIGREVTGRHKDGHPIPLELAVSEYRVRGERLFIGTLRDIRERRKLIHELTQARADAEQGSRAKTAFLATMSHEIRTPMNGVIGMVEVLARSRLSDEQHGLISTIQESATTLLGIIDDILDFSKIEAGRLQLEDIPVSVADLVEGITSSLVPVAARRAVALDVFVSPEIPERVLSDDVRLRQILYNLVGNAIKFSGGRPHQCGAVAIRATLVQSTPLRVAFSVADNGIGMAPETLQDLFTAFTQAEVSTTRQFGGTGLGLAICKRLVDLMGGQISVTSASGVGSTFTVTLPFAVPAEQPPGSLPELTGLECIVVANPGLPQETLRIYLEHAGASVRFVRDLAEVARVASGSSGPAVVLLDESSRGAWLHSTAASSAHLRPVVIGRGGGGRTRPDSNEVLDLDGSALRRRMLLRTVAIAAGRASPEILHSRLGDQALESGRQPPSVAEARASGQLILVAEDDAINQKVILHQLGLLGFAAEVANDGLDALRLWRAGQYALLLTDLHMPGMDGYALTASIRAEERGMHHMPVVALTANALRGEAHRAHAAGMDDYLTKPVQLDVLKAALDKWLPQTERPGPTQSGASRAPASSGARDVFEVQVLRQLVGDDAETIRALLADWLESARILAADLRSARAAKNIQELAAVTHKLKSSSRSVGALALGDVCADIENVCKAGDRGMLEPLLHKFDAALGAAEREIAGFLEEAQA